MTIHFRMIANTMYEGRVWTGEAIADGKVVATLPLTEGKANREEAIATLRRMI